MEVVDRCLHTDQLSEAGAIHLLQTQKAFPSLLGGVTASGVAIQVSRWAETIDDDPTDMYTIAKVGCDYYRNSTARI